MSIPAPARRRRSGHRASSGIGAAITRELAQRGHTVLLIARRKERLGALAEELTSAFGVRAEAIGADLGKAASHQRLPVTGGPWPAGRLAGGRLEGRAGCDGKPYDSNPMR